MKKFEESYQIFQCEMNPARDVSKRQEMSFYVTLHLFVILYDLTNARVIWDKTVFFSFCSQIDMTKSFLMNITRFVIKFC